MQLKKPMAVVVILMVVVLPIGIGYAMWGLHNAIGSLNLERELLEGIIWGGIIISVLLAGCLLGLVISLDKAGKLSRSIFSLREEASRSAYQKAQLEQFFAISPDILCTLDSKGQFIQVNPAAGHILGRTPEQMVGQAFLDMICDEDRPGVLERVTNLLSDGHRQITFDARTRTADGGYRWVEWSFVKVDWETLYFGYGRNIHDRKVMETKLHYNAFHDNLTEVANRELFLDRLNQIILRSHRHPTSYAVFILDLDNFKTVNDSYGHQVGDRILQLFVQKVQSRLRPQDTLARFGGDEFILLAEQIATPQAAAALADRILDSLRQPFVIDGTEFEVGFSLGIVLDNGEERDPDALIRKADLALYKAKEAGKGGYFIYDQALRNEQRSRAHLEEELRKAIQNGDLHAKYQAIVEAVDGSACSCEVLCRWTHAEMGEVSPEEFIPVAESSGLIGGIGRLMLAEACSALEQWRANGDVPDQFAISVNLSPREFFRVDLVSFIGDALEAHGLEGRHLCLEVTEGVLIERDEEASVILNRLREMGIRIYVDDFGTGYSSLSYLRTLPVDGIKLDKSFIEKIQTVKKSQEIARTVLELAKALKLRAVVEGVETPEQLAFLADLGFAYVQGFLLHAPCERDEFATWMQQRDNEAA